MGHIRNGRLIDLDLQRAVDSLTPALVIEPPSWEDKNASRKRCADMYEISLTSEEHGVSEVLNALLAKPALASRLAELATEALRSSIHLAIDAEQNGLSLPVPLPAYYERMKARPAVQRSLKEEGLL